MKCRHRKFGYTRARKPKYSSAFISLEAYKKMLKPYQLQAMERMRDKVMAEIYKDTGIYR